jgi:hypothetical protein
MKKKITTISQMNKDSRYKRILVRSRIQILKAILHYNYEKERLELQDVKNIDEYIIELTEKVMKKNNDNVYSDELSKTIDKL